MAFVNYLTMLGENIMNEKPICKRCLIRELNDANKMKSIQQYIDLTPSNDICHKDLYESRLITCKSCKYLNIGICMKNGYYVEARAYRTSGICPIKLY